MSHSIPTSIRLHPSEAAALDALAEREGGTRGQKIREAISLRLNVAATQSMIAEIVRNETQLAMRELLTAAQASDATSRKLITDFLEALGTHVDDPITELAPADDTAGGTKMPRRRD